MLTVLSLVAGFSKSDTSDPALRLRERTLDLLIAISHPQARRLVLFFYDANWQRDYKISVCHDCRTNRPNPQRECFILTAESIGYSPQRYVLNK